MKLIQVIYELYRSDADTLKGHEDDEFHALDREIRLCFEDHRAIWLSWSSEPYQFCVSFGYKPHFSGRIDELIDMTNCFMWSRFVGQELALTYCDLNHQVLVISAGSGSIWC